MTPQEIAKVQTFLRRKFDNDRIKLTRRNVDDSVEVILGNEHIGLVYKDEGEDEDDGEGELSYAFNMAILEIDLEEH